MVLGADSASTLTAGSSVVNVYVNAEKVFNLCKDLPIGTVTYGPGTLENRSMTELSKELRERFSLNGPWELKKGKFQMKDVLARMEEFFYKERYRKEWPRAVKDPAGKEVQVFAEMRPHIVRKP